MFKRLVCLLMLASLTGCSYLHIRRPIIEQGNVITQEDTSKLHKGMTPNEVVAVMGSPVLTNILTPNRMEYVYTYDDGTGKYVEKHVSCVFEGGRLQVIETRL